MQIYMLRIIFHRLLQYMHNEIINIMFTVVPESHIMTLLGEGDYQVSLFRTEGAPNHIWDCKTIIPLFSTTTIQEKE